MRLLLFDIDGTLVRSGGAGARALTRAFQDLHDIDDAMADIHFAGCTDPMIVRDIFQKKVGRGDREGEVQAVLERYLSHLADTINEVEGAAVLPGVVPLLEDLSGRPGVVLGLLTGNIEAGARIKLGRFDLNRFFAFGGFASDADDRRQIARIARQRGRDSVERPIEDTQVYVIGDTPKDVDCGRAMGARTLAVATGPHSREDLSTHSPDYLYDDLEKTVELVETFLADRA